MSNPVAKTAGIQHIAPPLAPVAIHDILRDADALLALMGKETLGVVAELANTLTVSAHESRSVEIEEAASNVRRLVSSGGPVVLTLAPCVALTDAIARTENAHAACSDSRCGSHAELAIHAS